MTMEKRLFDLGLALLLSLFLLPLALGIALLILIRSGRPIFYRSERMNAPDKAFQLWKFRTMRLAAVDSGVSGGDKRGRITPEGRILRRLHLDEIPQLLNILRGDMSFVGPRPPLRQYVAAYPELYTRVLASRPGVTGLATLVFHRQEERLLAHCSSAAQTDAVYMRRCIPRKATLDLIYQRHQSFCIDLMIVCKTVRQLFL